METILLDDAVGSSHAEKNQNLFQLFIGQGFQPGTPHQGEDEEDSYQDYETVPGCKWPCPLVWKQSFEGDPVTKLRLAPYECSPGSQKYPRKSPQRFFNSTTSCVYSLCLGYLGGPGKPTCMQKLRGAVIPYITSAVYISCPNPKSK